MADTSQTVATGASGAPSRVRAVQRQASRASALPLQLVYVYLIGTFVLFLTWPVNWPLYYWYQWVLLSFYVIVCYTTIGLGYMGGARGVVPAARPFDPRWVIVLGSLLTLALLVPSSYLYTGRYPWQVLSALAEQGEAYRRFQEQLLETQGQRTPIVIARAFTAPVTFAVVPLGIINWGRLGWPYRVLVVATALSTLLFGILRGTDREMAEIFIIGGSAFLVVLGRSSLLRASLLAAIKRYWKVGAIAAIFLIVAASLFTDRKAERLGGTDTVCANDSRICADLDAPAIAWMGERPKFSVSIFILSSCSGYYGLALGMEQDFRTTYGFGHSAYAMAVYELLTGDETLKTRSYTYRNAFQGWSPDYYWSTGMLWFANDVGFVGAVVVLALLAFFWGRGWRDATLGFNDAAGVIFCVMMLLFLQLPSTVSVLNALDGYLTLVVWTVVWARMRMTAMSPRVAR